MFLPYWLLQLSLIAHGVAQLPKKRCNTTEDNLYIIVDSSEYQDFLLERVKTFVQHFVSKSGDLFKTTTTLIDPFQQSVLRCLNGSSTQGILNCLAEFKRLMSLNRPSRITTSTLRDVLSFTNETMHYGNANDQEKANIIAWISKCDGSCLEIIDIFVNFRLDLVAKQILLFLPISEEDLHGIRKLFPEDIYFLNNFLRYHDKFIFKYFTPLNLMPKCQAGWMRYDINNPFFNRNCYKKVILPEKVSWNDASIQCNSFFSELPVIETNEELQFIKTTLHKAIHDTTTETIFVHVGLTKTIFGAFQWVNQGPFILGHTIESKNGNDKCVALKLAIRTAEKNESIIKEDGITWELVDCKKDIAEIVLCKRNLGNAFYRAAQQFQPESQALKDKMLTLKKEFIFNKEGGQIYLIAYQDNGINEYKELLFDCWDAFDTIVYSKVCNHFTDCSNGRDEAYCAVSNIGQKSDFLCVNPNPNKHFPLIRNVPFVNKCNGHQDCPDNSDEEGCDECMETRCSDGTCIPRNWVPRNGDECILYNKSNGRIYINVTLESSTTKQHEVINCNQLEDLDQGFKMTYDKETNNWAPKCLFLRGRSGQPIGCRDMSHLQDCVNFICDEEFIKCHQSYCIPLYLINDGVIDCKHGEDEREQTMYNMTGYFICNSEKANFIHPIQVCDGVAQCPHGDDELNCNVTCPPGFTCFGSAVMVNNISEVEQIKSFRIFDIQTKFLNTSGLDLSQLNELYILPNLLELHASNCNLESLDFILGYDMKLSVYYLDLSYNKFKEVIFWDYGLDNLENVQFLNVSGNMFLSNVVLFFLPGFDKLRKLDFSGTHISSLDAISLSSALRYLNVENTKLHSLKVIDFKKIRVLDFLNIRNTCLKESDTVNILSKLTITTDLYVDNIKYCCPQIVGTGIPKHVCHAPFDGISSCEDLIGDILKRSLLWLAALMSLVGNIMVLAFRIHYDRGMLKKGYGIFVTNLGIADFVMGVYLTVIASMDIYFRDNYVLHETDWRDSVLCKISGFLSTLSSETSTFFVLLITLERFLVIRFPFGDCRLSKWVIILLVVTSWIMGFTLALIPILFPQWTIYSSNGMCIGLPLTTDRQHGWQYSFGVFIGLNCICFLVIAFGQVLIFISMSNQRFIVTTLNATRRQQDINVAKQLFIVALSNFLCWFPICVTGLMSLNGHKVSPDSYAWFVIFVLPLNAAINPMIYTIPAIFKKWIEFNRVKQP